MPKVYTTETWIEHVVEKFPENAKTFDYSKVNYTSSKAKVLIHCNNCGNDFWQEASSHMKGMKCYICAGTNHCSWEELKVKLSEIHNNKYTYPDTENNINFEGYAWLKTKHIPNSLP